MGKLRHIAISVPDPEKSAQFYKAAFGLARARSYVGPHHVGFLADDVEEARRRVEEHGATHFMGAPATANGGKATTHFAEKYRDPGGIIFDISGHGWAGTAEWSQPRQAARAAEADDRVRSAFTVGTATLSRS